MTTRVAPMLHTLLTVRAHLHAHFLRCGWLVPALFPLALAGGRAGFNILFYGYIVWALLGVKAPRKVAPTASPPMPAGPIVLLLACLAAYLPGISQAIDAGAALKSWGTLVLYASVLPLTLHVLNSAPDKLETLMRALGIGALATLVLSYAELAVMLLSKDHFIARLDMRAVDLPFCLPFLLGWLGQLPYAQTTRRLAQLAAIVAVCAYVVLSDERGSVIGLLVVLLALLVMVRRLPVLKGLLAVALCCTLALWLNGAALLRGLSDPSSSLFEQLNAFSSWRLTLWLQALALPPPHPWIGVGMANAQHYPIVALPIGLEVRHLHNVWLDAWYETGWLGLAALLTTLAGAAMAVWRCLQLPDGRARTCAALAASAALAIVAQAQFSISYASREFNLYCLLALAIVLHLKGRSAEPAPAATPRAA